MARRTANDMPAEKHNRNMIDRNLHPSKGEPGQVPDSILSDGKHDYS